MEGRTRMKGLNQNQERKPINTLQLSCFPAATLISKTIVFHNFEKGTLAVTYDICFKKQMNS